MSNHCGISSFACSNQILRRKSKKSPHKPSNFLLPKKSTKNLFFLPVLLFFPLYDRNLLKKYSIDHRYQARWPTATGCIRPSNPRRSNCRNRRQRHRLGFLIIVATTPGNPPKFPRWVY